jgi:MFS transporter, DHA3 family, macrolide efflux protein
LSNIFKVKNFNFYFLGNLFSGIGDAIFTITLSWYIVDVHQSGYIMGTVLLLMGIARFVFGLIGGAIVDNMGPRRVMISSDLLRGIIIAVFYSFFIFSTIPLWLIIIISITFGIVDAFYWPAADAIKPRLVAKELYSKANSSYYTMVRILNIVGPAIGGFLLGLYSYSLIYLLIFISFILSAISINFIDLKEERIKYINKGGKIVRKFIDDVVEGLLFVKNEKILIILISTMTLANIGANGIMAVLPFQVKVLEFGANGLGMLQMSLALGSAIAGGIFTFKSIKTPSLNYVLIGFLGQGVFFGIITWFNSFTYILVSLFIVGIFTALVGVFIPTILQTIVPQQLMGRVSSVLMTFSMASTPISHFIFGFLTDLYSPSIMFLIAGLIETAVALIALFYVKKLKLKQVLERKAI